jgi:hypothetical protein
MISGNEAITYKNRSPHVCSINGPIYARRIFSERWKTLQASIWIGFGMDVLYDGTR